MDGPLSNSSKKRMKQCNHSTVRQKKGNYFVTFWKNRLLGKNNETLSDL